MLSIVARRYRRRTPILKREPTYHSGFLFTLFTSSRAALSLLIPVFHRLLRRPYVPSFKFRPVVRTCLALLANPRTVPGHKFFVIYDANILFGPDCEGPAPLFLCSLRGFPARSTLACSDGLQSVCAKVRASAGLICLGSSWGFGSSRLAFESDTHPVSCERASSSFALIGDIVELQPSSVCFMHLPPPSSRSARLTATGYVSSIDRGALSFSVSLWQLIVHGSSLSRITVHVKVDFSTSTSCSLNHFPATGDVVSFSGHIVAVNRGVVVVHVRDLTNFRCLSSRISLSPGCANFFFTAEAGTPYFSYPLSESPVFLYAMICATTWPKSSMGSACPLFLFTITIGLLNRRTFKTLRGALAIMQFELHHFYIVKTSLNSFNGTIEQIEILQPGSARPVSTLKHKAENLRDGPIHMRPPPQLRLEGATPAPPSVPVAGLSTISPGPTPTLPSMENAAVTEPALNGDVHNICWAQQTACGKRGPLHHRERKTEGDVMMFD